NFFIVPQDLFLFTGTVRDNIDPKRLCSDEELWRILESVNLSKIISSLDCEIFDGGASFSSGQKLIFSLARAVAAKNKIALLDEPKANLDSNNMELIKNVAENNFSSSTVLMIVHILHCIL